MAWFNVLKALREESGESMAETADTLNIAKSTYASYEYGKREPNIEMLNKIANHYHVTVDYLLGREPAPDDPVEMLSRELNLNLYEKAIVTAYLAMDTKSRTDLVKMVQTVADSVQSGTESKYTYTIQVAARGGEPPHTEEETAKTKEEA